MQRRQDLMWIKNALGLSMSELASLFSIERAVLYHWLDTSAPVVEEQSRIGRLRNGIERRIIGDYQKVLKHVWAEPLATGSTLLDVLRTWSASDDDVPTIINDYIREALKIKELHKRN